MQEASSNQYVDAYLHRLRVIVKPIPSRHYSVCIAPTLHAFATRHCGSISTSAGLLTRSRLNIQSQRDNAAGTASTSMVQRATRCVRLAVATWIRKQREELWTNVAAAHERWQQRDPKPQQLGKL